MSELNRQMATGDRGNVAIDDEVQLETKGGESKKHSKKKEKETVDSLVEKDESSANKEESRMGSSKEENRRKSSDFWLLWPQPSTRASMARFALLLLPSCVMDLRNRQIKYTNYPSTSSHS